MESHSVTNKYVIHVSTSLCYRLLCQEIGEGGERQIFGPKEVLQLMGFEKKLENSLRVKEMVFGHSTLRLFTGRILSPPVIWKTLMGLN